MLNYLIITNNPLVKENYNKIKNVEFVDTNYRGVLEKVRDYCLIGHQILTAPLSGSVKPNETPYKSIMISKNKKNDIDTNSLIIIDKAIETNDKFPKLNIKWKEETLKDFQLIDFTLIDSAMESIN